MLTKADFQAAIADVAKKYPAVAPLIEAGDPRVTMQLEAMATMFAMMSSQVEAAIAEPFSKSRASTVMADAAMRGIVQKSSPARVRIKVENRGTSAYTMNSGRTVIDSSGLPYRVETSATIPAGSTGTVEAKQVRTTVITHTVSGSIPFYAIEIPEADDGQALFSIAVRDQSADFIWRNRYVNTDIGERVFHVESDDRQRLFIRFGFDAHVGHQPSDGDVITLTISYSAGADANPAFGSTFSFDYIASPDESALQISMDALLVAGQDPISITTLREIAKYPSVYDDNAVFMGEFDSLVRRRFPSLQFVSCWNEAAEEAARGASADHINCLFVACLSQAGGEAVLDEPNPLAPVAPTLIADGSLTETQLLIRLAISQADDSYRVKFYTPVRSKVGVTITARVPTSYVAFEVESQIREAVLAEYGQASSASRRGFNRPLYQRLYSLLKEKVIALSGGSSDLEIQVQNVPSMAARPELWRYVSSDSLTVTVSTVNVVTGSWGI